MVLNRSSRVSTLPKPPVNVENPELAAWVDSAYTTITQLTSAYQRLQGNISAGQASQGTGAEGPPGGTQTTEININALRPDGVIIVVDGTIYPLSVEGVNAALQKASSKGGGTVMVPCAANIQVYSTSVKIPNRCALVGFGPLGERPTFTANASTNVTSMVENETQDGTQHLATVENISISGAKGTGAIVSAGLRLKSIYVLSRVKDILIENCSGSGFILDGGLAGVTLGQILVDNIWVNACDDHNILLTGPVQSVYGIQIASESPAAGKAAIKITNATATASVRHTFLGVKFEGTAAYDGLHLDGCSAVTVVGISDNGSGAANNLVKITGSVTGEDGVFASAGHVIINAQANLPVAIDDQVASVQLGTNTGSRCIPFYVSPIATAQTGTNSIQMCGIQPQRLGPSTASAATVTLTDGSVFPITGTTAIANITNAMRFAGKLFVMKTASALQVQHLSGGTGNVRMLDAANGDYGAGDYGLYFSDGVNSYEIARASATAGGGIYLRRDGGNTVTGTINFNNFSISGWRGASSSSAAQIDIISNKTAVAGAGINMRWNAAAAVAAGYYPLTVQYDNATGTRDVLKMGYKSTTESVLWLPDKDGGNDAGITENHIAAGSSNAIVTDTGTVGLRLLPNSFSGAIWFYVGAELALDIRKSGKLVQFSSGYLFANTGVFGASAGPNGTDFGNMGSYQWGFSSNLTPAAGLHTGWLRGLGGSLTATDYSNHLASLDYLGQFRSGQHGDAAQAPADGGFSAAGWYEASTATNQAGTDLYLRTGRGTGTGAADTTKGALHIQTPDAGASGTAVQSLTTKWSITRAGVLTAAEAMDVAVGTTTGTKIGTATSQKLGFYNATPVVQRTDAGALTDSTGGTANGTLVDVGVLFNQANINDNFADCAAKINALRTAMRDLGLMA